MSCALIAVTSVRTSHAQAFVDPLQTVTSLKGVKPLARDVSDYIPNKPAARLAAQQLGKALFWDTQVGSDGIACASCHFHAGADVRVKNQVNPGLRAVPADVYFDPRSPAAGGTGAGPNQTFTAADFPLHELSSSFNRMSEVLFDTNDVVSSQGTFAGDFISSARKWNGPKGVHQAGSQRTGNETCTLTYSPLTTAADGTVTGSPFHANGLIYRKVEPRQTPTVINAVFNYRQFWDGRANSQFNGVDPFGPRTYQPQRQLVNANGGMELVGNEHAATTGILIVDPSQPPKAVASIGFGIVRSLFQKSSFALPARPSPLKLVQPVIENSSLASQAVGPPLSDFEMSCSGKTFADLGRKLLDLRPLANQRINAEDSLFSQTPEILGLADRGFQQKALNIKGLSTTYRALIQAAFNPKYWADTSRVVVKGSGTAADPVAIVADPVNGFTQMEHNFSLFWGLAIQEYESLLISDDSPFDRGTMSPAAVRGKQLFETRGNCVACHHGPLLSAATITSADSERPKVIENMLMFDGFSALYDTGFYNIGSRLSWDDLGAGAKDPYGFDLSFARQYKWRRVGQTERSPDAFDPKPCLFQIPFGPQCTEPPAGTTPQDAQRDAIDGAFKVPILRNVGLNPPYFHNGGQSNLRDVLHFYKRGGDRRDIPGFDRFDSSWFGPTPFGVYNSSNVHPDIGDKFNADDNTVNAALDLTDAEMDDIVQFLLSLTDERVACHADVFDHPELPLPLGQKDIARPGTQLAEDIVGTLPATGKRGLGTGRCFPNSGDLFDQPDLLKVINKDDPRGLQTVFHRIVQ